MKCIYVLTVLFMGLGMGLGASPVQARRLWLELGVSPIHLSERPANTGYPRRGTRRGGGSRGGVCDLPTDVPPLTALMPDTATWAEPNVDPDDIAGEIVFSFTRRAAPDLWFYQPYGLVENSRVEFTLKDSADNTVSRSRLEPMDATATVPGIMRVSLGDLGLTLMPNVDYHWYLTVHCTPGPPVVVDGWINYWPGGGHALPQANKQFLVDTLSALAEAQFLPPDPGPNLENWQELLDSIGLGDIADVPVMDCCSFVEQPQN